MDNTNDHNSPIVSVNQVFCFSKPDVSDELKRRETRLNALRNKTKNKMRSARSPLVKGSLQLKNNNANLVDYLNHYQDTRDITKEMRMMSQRQVEPNQMLAEQTFDRMSGQFTATNELNSSADNTHHLIEIAKLKT
jgi:hypothetical protein